MKTEKDNNNKTTTKSWKKNKQAHTHANRREQHRIKMKMIENSKRIVMRGIKPLLW